jgi:hypothetical protein
MASVVAATTRRDALAAASCLPCASLSSARPGSGSRPCGRDALNELLDLAQSGIGRLIALQKQAVGHILK